MIDGWWLMGSLDEIYLLAEYTFFVAECFCLDFTLLSSVVAYCDHCAQGVVLWSIDGAIKITLAFHFLLDFVAAIWYLPEFYKTILWTTCHTSFFGAVEIVWSPHHLTDLFLMGFESVEKA